MIDKVERKESSRKAVDQLKSFPVKLSLETIAQQIKVNQLLQNLFPKPVEKFRSS